MITDKPIKSNNYRRIIKTIYKNSTQYSYDKLMAEQARWSRKMTIAQNKLEKVRLELDKLTKRLVTERDGGEKIVDEPTNTDVVD